MLIVFCFLNSWRSTVITGLTLPVSVISAFIVMNFGGMTLNIMTLMALSLAIGLLIDDAIVVRENIVRHLERGQDHITAARDGTSEIGLAVMATTLSIIAVFVPVAFMKGIVGRFFYQFGITVAFAVLVSLFVSFTLDPMLSSRWVDPDVERQGQAPRRGARARPVQRLVRPDGRPVSRRDRLGARTTGWSCWRSRSPRSSAASPRWACWRASSSRGTTRRSSRSSFRTAPSASIEETRGRVEAVVAMLREFPEVEHTYASIARARFRHRPGRPGLRQAHRARVRGRARQQQLQRLVRARLYEIPGIMPSVMEAGRFDDRKPLLVNVRGEDLAQLKRYASELKQEPLPRAGPRGPRDDARARHARVPASRWIGSARRTPA